MWGTDLWDQYEAVCSHVDNRSDQVKRLAAFVKDRVKVEQDYAKELRKLSRSYCKMKADETKFLSTECFAKAVQHAEELAFHHEVFSNKLQSDVYESLKKLTIDQAKEKKQVMVDAAKQHSTYSAALASHDKVKKKYESAQADADKAYAAFQKADADMTLSRAAVEKVRKTSDTKGAESEEARAHYQTAIDEANSFQHDHFNVKMPVVFQQLQKLDETRTSEMSSNLMHYVKLESETLPLIEQSEDKIRRQCQDVNPEADSARLVEEIRSGLPIPPDLVIDEGGAAPPTSKMYKKHSTSAGGSGANDLFENLLPAKRRKKLTVKITELKSSTKKEEAELKGLQKLVSVYTDNPSLGDASVVSEKLSPLCQRVESLNDELYRFECALAQMDGKDMPAPPTAPSASSPTTLSVSEFAPVPPPPSYTSTPDVAKETWDDEFDDGGTQRCHVLYDFAATADGEINVYYDETLELVENDGSGWISVRRENEQGYIPLSYVEMV